MAKEGLIFVIICLVLAVAVRVALPSGRVALALLILLAAFSAFFFRDPQRSAPKGDHLILAPADGKVVFVGEVEGGHFFDVSANKVSIFMSLLDVHVNRAPVSGLVKKIIYNEGSFFKANTDKASLDNEQNWVIIEKDADRLAFVQIAGLVARRIVCKISEGQVLTKGEKVGLIMFGSRVDLYLPRKWKITVREGDRVRAGESVVGEL
jgi:phosphatidylserine decarboxylase